MPPERSLRQGQASSGVFIAGGLWRAYAKAMERPVRRALLVVKQSTVDRVQNPDQDSTVARVRALLEEESEAVAGLKASHEEHTASVRLVRQALKERGIQVTERATLPTRPLRDYDLVVAVGGDGMVLGVSHSVRDGTPVLGVNSAPTFSVGYLSGCTASGFPRTLSAYQRGELAPLEVQRLQVTIAERPLEEPVLNDVLFCADNPAMMARYVLRWPDGEEAQRSSGVWVSTPAGSTSALASAGGPILPLKAKQFAFVVREPYAPPGASVRYRSAVLDADQGLSFECRTWDASVFLDGNHLRHPIRFGERFGLSLHPVPLRLVRPPR